MRLLEFGAQWCGVCRGMKPIVEKLVTEKTIKKEYIDLETEDGRKLANIAGVTSLPTYILIKNEKVPSRNLSSVDFHGCKLAVGQHTETGLIKKLGLG